MVPSDHPMIPRTVETLENLANGDLTYLNIVLKYREELKIHFDYLIKRGLYETLYDNDDLIKLEKRNRFYRNLRDNIQ